jgi:hypothetical protein
LRSWLYSKPKHVNSSALEAGDLPASFLLW